MQAGDPYMDFETPPNTPDPAPSSLGDGIKRGGTQSCANTNLVYASAALGVVHDLRTNQQTLFAGHDDDITCITLSNRGELAATGQMGKSPVVHIWSTAPTPRRSTDTKAANSAAGGCLACLCCVVCFVLYCILLPDLNS
jgi:hypothetical protein